MKCFESNRKKDAYSHNRLNAGKQTCFRRLTCILKRHVQQFALVWEHIEDHGAPALKFAALSRAVP